MKYCENCDMLVSEVDEHNCENGVYDSDPEDYYDEEEYHNPLNFNDD